MYGVIDGVYIKNDNRVQELNSRIYDRNKPSTKLQSQFDPRSVQTRHVVFPVLDCHNKSNTPIEIMRSYNQEEMFNPGTSAPYSGFANNVDSESQLKDIFMARQKWTAQTKYIPSTKSDMYQVNITQQPNQQTHSLLFKEESFSPFNPNICNIDRDAFNNHTRQQMLDISLQGRKIME